MRQYARNGLLKGFGMVYLGQMDEQLPYAPPDRVRREEVKDYPINFATMAQEDLDALSFRGEHTRLLLRLLAVHPMTSIR